MLSRNLNDGTSNFKGVASDAVTLLGSSYVDLHGYGPILQNILGAAAYCEFVGDVGGEWPDPSTLWPPLNQTTNVVFGPVLNGRPLLSTVLLNYGPGWQYNAVSENSLPGGQFRTSLITRGPMFPSQPCSLLTFEINGR
jgi:hypothetical protein